MPEPGNLLEHVHSKTKYWYVGVVPQNNLHVIVEYEDNHAYTVGTTGLNQYYERVPIPFDLREGQTYVSRVTEATFEVEKIMTNPDNGRKSAFGWYRRKDSVADATAQVQDESFWVHWIPL